MYYTGLDPFTKKPVQTAKNLNDRKLQRALMQFFKPENYFAVREGLIPANPPKEALEQRRREANRAVRGAEDSDHYHTVANPAGGEKAGERGAGPVKSKGYRPGRKSQQRRHDKRKKSGPGA